MPEISARNTSPATTPRASSMRISMPPSDKSKV
jgi:hypothetical protein